MKTLGLKLNMVAHMMAMQNTMNTIVIGRDWVDSANHPNVDFIAAMSAEAGEFPDHMGFKWWKKQEADIHQAKLELVDMYHFMISHIAQFNFQQLKRQNGKDEKMRFTYNELKDIALDKTTALVVTGAANMVQSSQCGLFVDQFEAIECKAEKRRRLLRTVRRIVEVLEVDSIIRATMDENNPRTVEDSITEAVDVFFVACALIGMSGKELYLNYVGKNVLNRFRQDNGYKDGSYVKIWNGLEDNQVLEGFIKTQASIDNLDVSTIDFEATVYKHLERHYPKQSATAVKQSA